MMGNCLTTTLMNSVLAIVVYVRIESIEYIATATILLAQLYARIPNLCPTIPV